MTATTILAIDPGTRHTGYAILRTPDTLVTSGTFIPKGALRGTDRHVWLISKLQDLVTVHQPQVLAYESFTWMPGENDVQYLSGRDGMCKLAGGIAVLSLYPPFPMLLELLPQSWGAQLVGTRTHTKQQIAWAVNVRLGTTFQGSVYDNHEADSVGIALVAADRLRHSAYIARHSLCGGAR